MADNVAVTPGSGATIAADEVVDGTLGTVKVQFVKLMDGTLDGTNKSAVSSAGLKVDLAPATVGGLSVFRLLSAASTNSNTVKGSAGQVYGWYIYNNAASTRFVRLYNKATAPTVGTDTPFLSLPIPAGGGSNIAFPVGIAFGTGIGLGITAAVGDSDTTACSLNDVILNLLYV